MRAIHLKCEYRTNPLGIDALHPLLRWKCDVGKEQQAYQITVRDEMGVTVWDSGKRFSSSMHSRYDGPIPQSGQRLYWTVRLWDETGQPGESEEAWFEMGLLTPEDWHAYWICGQDTDRSERLPADCYRKDFTLPEGLIRVRLYATACGVYSATLNGTRLPGILCPGTTEYEKRLYYQTYDVTELLKEENSLRFTVGDGWFKGKLGSDNVEYLFGTQVKLLAQLVVDFADGHREIIGTDESWLWSNDGPIVYSDLKDGEIYDARKIPSFSRNAQITNFATHPTASPAGGIEEHECMVPELLISPSGTSILDFGQNMAGYVRFTARGASGQTIRLRLGEVLDHGEFSNETLLYGLPGIPSTNQEIVYICDGQERQFQPDFFYSGFRYALVEGIDTIDPQDFCAVAVYSNLDFCGSFCCSNEKINQFAHNTLWSLKSNFVDVPTDCPQREKSGWTGDAQIFVRAASYFADTAAFYRKWLRDVRDCQREDGRVNDVCPRVREPAGNRDAVNGAAGWADAAIIIPYTLWKLYGDDTFITENYEMMRDWAAYVRSAAADKSYHHLPEKHPLKAIVAPFLLPDSPLNRYAIESGVHWGEWSEPGVDGGAELVQPKPELTTAYLHYSMDLLAEMLRAVGKDEEAAVCQEYADGAKSAYNHYFVKDGSIQAPRQAPMVRALALGLLDGQDAVSVAAQLNQSAIDRNYTVGTGFLSTPFVLQTLSEFGYVTTAYQMLENTDAPGWLAMVEQGATTVWEAYSVYDENSHPLKLSMNHYSPGAVCAFLFDTVCGIRVDGENHFCIHPIPGGTLRNACAEYDSPYGKVSSSWEKQETATLFRVEIPANTVAELILPDGQPRSLTYGSYNFEVKYK